jgi:VWFA-related protein
MRLRTIVCSTLLLWAIHSAIGQTPTIHVPVRLVSVPTLVARGGKYLPGLAASDFRLTDNNQRQIINVDTEAPSIAVVIAVQMNQDVREYLPFIAKAGSLIENSLAMAAGQIALITYNDEVSVAKNFTSGDFRTAMRRLAPAGNKALMLDAGLRAIDLLTECPAADSRVLVFIGQPMDHGSSGTIGMLEGEAERKNVQVYALMLPTLNKSFISDSFRLWGLPGGIEGSAELTKVIPALRRAGDASTHGDPFSLLTAASGGLQTPFRNQKQLENATIALGDALRSRYILSYTPDGREPGFHKIVVTVNVSGATVYARPGYFAR